jgi:hypothetical protein
MDEALASDRVAGFLRTRTGGVEVEHAPAAVLFLRDEVLTRLEFHLDRRLAFAAAGLA